MNQAILFVYCLFVCLGGMVTVTADNDALDTGTLQWGTISKAS